MAISVKTNFKAATNENGTQYGYGTITIDECIVMRNVRVMKGHNGEAYLSFPSYKKEDNTYQKKCSINNKEIYDEALRGAMNDIAAQTVMDGPDDMYGEIKAKVTIMEGKNNLKALATVEVMGITIYGIQVYGNSNGIFVNMPQSKSKSQDNNEPMYQDVVYPTKKRLRDKITKTVLKEYQKSLEPVIHVTWSEHPDLADDSYLPFHKANQLFKELDGQQVKIRQEPDYRGELYYKTYFELQYKMAGGTHIYEGRQDLGEGGGSLIDYIRGRAEYHRNDETWREMVLKDRGTEDWEQNVKKHDNTLNAVIPYLELHNSLGKLLENDERMLRLYGSMETPERQEYEAYHKKLEAYVTACREKLNSGTEDAFLLPAPPELVKMPSKGQEQQEISKNRERALEKLGLKGEEYKESEEQPVPKIPRRYGVDEEGNTYRTFNGKRPEEFSKEDQILFMIDTDLMLNGSMSDDMKKMLKEEGYQYENGKLTKQQVVKDGPKSVKRIMK